MRNGILIHPLVIIPGNIIYIYIYLIITIYWWTLYSIVYHYLQEYEKCAIWGNFTAYLIGKNQHFKDITNDFKMPLSPK